MERILEAITGTQRELNAHADGLVSPTKTRTFHIGNSEFQFNLFELNVIVIAFTLMINRIPLSFIRNFHAFYLPMNITIILCGCLYGLIYINVLIEDKDKEHVDPVNDIITYSFMYFALLPIIAIGEGLNIDKTKYFVTGKRVFHSFVKIALTF